MCFDEDRYIAATSDNTDPYRTPEEDNIEDEQRDYDAEAIYWESRFVALGFSIEEAA